MRRILIASLFVLPLFPQSITIPNNSFETGTDAPSNWSLSGAGEWEREGASGDRSIKVTGNGDDSSYWKCDSFSLKPSRIYRVTFQARSQNAAGGCAISGPSTLNRDYTFDSFWRTYGYAFKLPDNAADSYLRFGQWHVKGSVLFDDVNVFEVEPLQRTVNGMELGLTEYIRGNTYKFAPVYSGEGANYARCLVSHTAGFNSTRWVMSGGSFIIYRHRVGQIAQASASVRINIGYYAAGALIIEASTDGTAYTAVGEMSASGSKEFALPSSLFPAEEISIRLMASSSETAGGESKPGAFQINNYEYTAPLASSIPDAVGDTQFATILVKGASLAVKLISLGSLDADPVVKFKTRASADGDYTAVFAAGEKQFTKRFSVKADAVSMVDIPFSLPITEPGIMPVTLTIRDAKSVVYSVSSSFTVDTLSFANFGERLAAPAPLGLWWSSAAYKISRTRPVPKAAGAVKINAAKNEYESFQISLRPSKDIARVTLSASDLTRAGGIIGASNISFGRVGYVDVRVPSDPTGVIGNWPDPIEKIRGAFPVPKDMQSPIWVTVHIPFDAAAGEYTGTITLTADGERVSVPITITVWNFGLPLEPSLKSAFEMWSGPIKKYHNLSDASELKDVMDRYYRDFAEHRISPQNALRQPLTTFVKDASGKAVDLSLDFTDFDADGTYYLDTLGFSVFRLTIAGMGSGTFFSRKEGEFGGHKQGSPEYDALWGKYIRTIQDHLEAKGWLSKAYVYWFDEPDVKDYQFVIDGMSLLKKHAPKIRRLLTEEVVPDLAGAVDIWCPHVNGYNELVPGRIAAGEEFWWYVCTGPKAPYIGIFIDHPAIDMRIWGWMSWKNKATGILVWAVNWWTSAVAFTNKA
ncbi:MAG: glycoside hydrolase domain-containing protein, partial [Spirochaetota bacterium]